MTAPRSEPATARGHARGIVATRFELPDAEHQRLRAIVATIDRAIAVLPRPKTAGENSTTGEVLLASWGELTRLLALGPARQVRACPACGQMAMRGATVCGDCWKKLPPPDDPLE